MTWILRPIPGMEERSAAHSQCHLERMVAQTFSIPYPWSRRKESNEKLVFYKKEENANSSNISFFQAIIRRVLKGLFLWLMFNI